MTRRAWTPPPATRDPDPSPYAVDGYRVENRSCVCQVPGCGWRLSLIGVSPFVMLDVYAGHYAAEHAPFAGRRGRR